jgi:Uma2 family endonuclease
MQNVNRLTAAEFLEWQARVEGRYELVDGHIVPHPDYFGPQGFAFPDNEHALVCTNLLVALRAQLQPPCRVYVGAGTLVDATDVNGPDVAVSCCDADVHRKALQEPRFIFEVSSPKTARVDTGRKVTDYLSLPTVEAYVHVDRPRRALTMYRNDGGPQTYRDGRVALADGIEIDVRAVFEI